MLKFIYRSAVLALAVTCSVAAGAAEKFSETEPLGRWITYYYLNPEPQLVAEAIHAASSKGFMKEGKGAPSFIGFVAGVVNKNPTVAQTLVETLPSLPEIDRPVVILGIWYSGHPDAKSILQSLAKSLPAHKEIIDHLVNNAPLGILELPLEQGSWVLDALWGYFMATGDDAPVSRIITVLPWVNVSGDVSRLVVGGAAKWSLISNAIQHKRVMKVCRREMVSQPKDLKKLLTEVVETAEKDMKAGKKS